MRHGESEANVSGVIVSDPAIGCERFGLTEHGLQQISAAVNGFTGKPITQIVCSDFLRTMQTAQLVAEILHLPQPQQENNKDDQGQHVHNGQQDEEQAHRWYTKNKTRRTEIKHTMNRWETITRDQARARTFQQNLRRRRGTLRCKKKGEEYVLLLLLLSLIHISEHTRRTHI